MLLKFIKDLTRPLRKSFNRLYRERVVIPKLDDIQLRAVMRHEAHRIEKSYYNDVYSKNPGIYNEKADLILKIISRLSDQSARDEPDVLWAQEIAENVEKLDCGFINGTASKAVTGSLQLGDTYNKVLRSRRSCRRWASSQPGIAELKVLAKQLVESALLMPSSGNRQGARFLCLITDEQKSFLKGLKERHCYGAPLVVLCFADSSVYGSYETFGSQETCIFVDSSAAASAILIGAEMNGYSTCWNHFGPDLIKSRKSNKLAYERLCKRFKLSSEMIPVAAIAIGKELHAFPVPKRMSVNKFLLNNIEE